MIPDQPSGGGEAGALHTTTWLCRTMGLVNFCSFRGVRGLAPASSEGSYMPSTASRRVGGEGATGRERGVRRCTERAGDGVRGDSI